MTIKDMCILRMGVRYPLRAIKTSDIPFVIYADFESFIVPIDYTEGNPEESHTTQYQRHEPSGFCYTIKCFDESVHPGKTVLHTMEEDGEDIGKKFVESVEEDMSELYTWFKNPKPINMSEIDEENFRSAKDCYAYGKGLDGDRVRDHGHYIVGIEVRPITSVTSR